MPGVSGVIVMVLPKFWLSIPAPNIAVVLASAKTRASKTGVRNFPNFFILFLLTFLLLTRKYETKNILYEKLTGVRNSLRLSEKEEIRENVLAGMAYAKEHGTKSGLPVGRPRVDIGFTKVCKALRLAEFSYTEAAKALNKETGEKITPGFIYNRVKREADVRGVSMEELKAVIANEGTRDNGTL